MLKVHEIFESIQGQGENVGYPTLFIRLFGCDRDCEYCDTMQTTYKEIDIKKLVKKIKESKLNSVCITGGEPTKQQELKKLLKILQKEKVNKCVEVFTNGYNFDVLKGNFPLLKIRWDVKDFHFLKTLKLDDDLLANYFSMSLAFTITSKEDFYKLEEARKVNPDFFHVSSIEVTATDESYLSKWLAKKIVKAENLMGQRIYMGSRLHKVIGVR